MSMRGVGLQMTQPKKYSLFLSKEIAPENPLAYIFKLPVRYKLHDVSHRSLASRGAQAPVVSVQELHGSEICVPNPNNDDRHGQAGGVDDGIPGLVHVCDDSVSNDEEDKVLLWRRRHAKDRKAKI